MNRQSFQIIRLAFPYDNYIPPKLSEFFLIISISFEGAFELGKPVILTTGRCCCMRAVLMSMPEATMNKHHSAVFRKDDVRLARQILPVQAKPAAKLVEEGADPLFRCCISRTNVAHDVASFFWRKCIQRLYPTMILKLGSVSQLSMMRL